MNAQSSFNDEITGALLAVEFNLIRATFTIDFDFVCKPGIGVITGPSGCGKTSLLDCISGLLEPTSGYIKRGPFVLFDSTKNVSLPPQLRRIGYVLQRQSLFPHMTVRDNIAFAIDKIDRKSSASRILELAGEFGITQLLERRPGQISGGQAQRVALVRAIATDPEIYLFDEPLSNLDEQSRTEMIEAVKKVRSVTGKSILYVTHSAVEADELADYRIVCQNNSFRLK